jgi:hypothetical protein
VLLLQMGVEPLQSLLLRHPPPLPPVPPLPVVPPVPPPLEQVLVVGSHVPPLQSRSLKHWTHSPSPEQSGALVLVHSLATAHSTQRPPALQIFFVGSVQSAPLMHATQ